MTEYWRQSEAGIAATHDYRILRPDGEVRWVRAKTAPIDDPDVRLRRSASTVEDITVVRHAEAARRDATVAVERANTAKSQFFSRTSHELRTPLNAVLGFGQLLELDPLTADQHNAVQHILRGGRHLVALIDDLLDISKIEGGRLDTSVEDVLLTGLLTDVVAVMTAPACAVGVTLSYQPPEDHERPVRADHRRMRQVMINLVSNGINFNRPGGSVAITWRYVGDFAEIDVRDTGRGISADSIPRLFSTFDRLDAESAGVPGTGIALALSHRLMQVMGGGLEVTRSQIGIGSTFTVSVPLAATSTEMIAAADVPAAEVSADPTGRVKTLVYIEDNQSNITLIERLMTHRPGWRIIAAGNGANGLNLVARSLPDVVLLDLHLPDMDGISLLRTLRQSVPTRGLKIVVASADSNPHQVQRLLAAGADAYLVKPLKLAEILQVLDTTAGAAASPDS